MGENVFSKLKNWLHDDEEEYNEDTYEESNEVEEEEIVNQIKAINSSKSTAKIVNIHTNTQMKLVISQPKTYNEVTEIADHLKQRRSVIVNLDEVENLEVRKSIFNFMNGAVYVLDGDIQKISKTIFVLAPSNVDIDANIKKELERKAFFPWENK
jgi:cell division inhibitor SepF